MTNNKLPITVIQSKTLLFGKLFESNTKKLTIFILKHIQALIVLMLGLAHFAIISSTNGQNIALGKPYTYSEVPNYEGTAPDDDFKTLTDGVFTLGYFWIYKTTVGWQKKSRIAIKIDLEGIESVGTIKFSTAAGVAGVHAPRNIYIFCSQDDVIYEYLGDMLDQLNLPDTTYGTYGKFTLTNDHVDRKTRYILFEIIPRGPYLFCDEIEVYKEPQFVEKKKAEYVAYDRIPEAIDSLLALDFQRRELSRDITHLPRAFLKESRMDKNAIRTSNYKDVRERLGKEYGNYLNNKLKARWVFEDLNCWDTLSKFHEPKSVGNIPTYNFSLPINGVQYGSFVLTNTSNKYLEFSIETISGVNKTGELELFEVVAVPISDGITVHDPLIPVSKGCCVAPGNNKMFMFRLTGVKRGNFKGTIRYKYKKDIIDIAVCASIISLPIPSEKDKLSVNVWAYFNYPILKSRKLEAARNLVEHHVNTVEVPPSVIPMINEFDFSNLRAYLKPAKGIQKVLLFNAYNYKERKAGYPGGKFMSDDWKRMFIAWYARIQSELNILGYKDDQIYFYPYDEITDKAEVEDFVRLIQWARQNIKGIMFYATIGELEAYRKLSPYLDVVQVHSNLSIVGESKPSDVELWTYGTISPARTLHPYSYYRLMAWRAFLNDFRGIGFWNFADCGKNTDNPINKLYLNLSTEYSVIYTGACDVIYSSRRWESFRLGIEDYWIIKSYSNKYGVEKAIHLVREVVTNPAILNLADRIRNQMLSEL